MYTLGINLSHHSSIALLKDNEVLLFILEERVNRSKYYCGVPLKALDLVKNYTTHIDCILGVSGSLGELEECMQHLKNQGVVIHRHAVGNRLHHMAHAAAGFYMSGFDDATIIVVDGAGAMHSLGNSSVRVSETTSFYEASFPNIKCTNKHFVIGIYDSKPLQYTDNDKRDFRNKYSKIPISVTENLDIGWRYATVTSQIGFGVFGEGKTMGLSAYGNNSSLSPNMQANALKAYNIQKELEESFLELAGKVKTPNLVLSGGCALNILGNSLIKRHFPNLNIFVDPVAADSTIALGIATYFYYSRTHDINKLVFGAYQGPQYNFDKNYIYECARKYSI